MRHCSDGGLNSFAKGHDSESGTATFHCGHGTQCNNALCSPRIEDATLCLDSCINGVSGRVRWEGRSRNGICEDGGEYSTYRNDPFPDWSELPGDLMYALESSKIVVTDHGLVQTTAYTFEQCGDLCTALGGGNVCKYFFWGHGENGRCVSGDSLDSDTVSTPLCDESCITASTTNNPLSECRMYDYYTGITSQTVQEQVGCTDSGTYRMGIVTSESQGALPLLDDVDYTELPKGDNQLYGNVLLLKDKDNYLNLYGLTNQRYTFKECAIMCKTYPNKLCKYFLWKGSVDDTVTGCDAGATDPGKAVCEIYARDGTPTTDSSNNPSLICMIGTFRHALMNNADYMTWPVDSNGIPYTAIGGCGMGTDCTDCGPRTAVTKSNTRRLQDQIFDFSDPPSPPSPPPPTPPPSFPPPSPPPSPSPPPQP